MRYLFLFLLLVLVQSPAELSAKRKQKRRPAQVQQTAQAEPLRTEWKGQLKAKIEERSFPAWMLEQIQEDLEPFKISGISLKDIDTTIKDYEPHGFVVCKIQNGSFSYKCYPEDGDFRSKMLADAIRELVKTVALPDVTFLVYKGEAFTPNENKAPVFTWCKHYEKSKRSVNIPDYEALNGNFNLLKDVQVGVQRFPWSLKQNKAFWRGAPTGGCSDAPPGCEFTKTPRIKLAQLSKQFPDLIDANLTALYPGQDTDEQLKSVLTPLVGSSAGVTEHLRYKYQILADGHVSAFSRAYWQLFSNCVIFKHDSVWYQWFYRGMKPYVHYIPYKYDSSDLIEKLQWAATHDNEALQISQNANDFANKNLKYSDVMLYVYLLLNEYAKLQRP